MCSDIQYSKLHFLCVASFVVLRVQGLKKAKEVRAQLLDIMKQQKIPVNTAGNDWDIVRKAICAAYFQVSFSPDMIESFHSFVFVRPANCGQ